jgi:hypothetical protein
VSGLIPNSFQVPNAFVDELMMNISGNATKCYLLIVRKTVGWGKEKDRISVSQFMEYTGIKKDETIAKLTKELSDFGLIKIFKKKGKLNEFSLNIPQNNHPQSEGVPPINGTTDKGGITTPDKRGSTKPTVQNPIIKESKPKKNSTVRFKPPTIEQVTEYIREKELTHLINPVKFYNHYKTANWYRGKTKIRCWKSCVKTWAENQKEWDKQKQPKINAPISEKKFDKGTAIGDISWMQ